jgi:DNA-binding NarL/FixJ family response regulator
MARGERLDRRETLTLALGESSQPPATTSSASVSLAALTGRQHEVLRGIAAGRSDAEIADALGIGVRTVETHVANVYARLDVANRAEAAAVAVRLGLA